MAYQMEMKHRQDIVLCVRASSLTIQMQPIVGKNSIAFFYERIRKESVSQRPGKSFPTEFSRNIPACRQRARKGRKHMKEHTPWA